MMRKNGRRLCRQHTLSTSMCARYSAMSSAHAERAPQSRDMEKNQLFLQAIWSGYLL